MKKHEIESLKNYRSLLKQVKEFSSYQKTTDEEVIEFYGAEFEDYIKKVDFIIADVLINTAVALGLNVEDVKEKFTDSIDIWTLGEGDEFEYLKELVTKASKL